MKGKGYIILVYVIAACAMTGLVSCKTTSARTPGTGLDHPNLRRFRDHQINQIIITAWDSFDKRNYESSALDFERLIAKAYIDDDILFGAGIANYRLLNMKKALGYATGAIEKNPLHFEAIFLRATIYQSLGRQESSRQDLTRLAGMGFDQPLVCGYYFRENDIADRVKFEERKSQAGKLLGGI